MGRKQKLIQKNIGKGKKLAQYDKASMKVIREYKKLKQEPQFAKRKGFFDEDTSSESKPPTLKAKNKLKPTNNILLAQKTGEERKQKQKSKQEEAMKNIEIRNKKRQERIERRKKLNAKTPKGQPIMNNKIEDLLNKIQRNPDLYQGK